MAKMQNLLIQGAFEVESQKGVVNGNNCAIAVKCNLSVGQWVHNISIAAKR